MFYLISCKECPITLFVCLSAGLSALLSLIHWTTSSDEQKMRKTRRLSHCKFYENIRVHTGETYAFREVQNFEVQKGFQGSLTGVWWGTQNHDISKSWLTYSDFQNSACLIHINFKDIRKHIFRVSIEVIEYFPYNFFLNILGKCNQEVSILKTCFSRNLSLHSVTHYPAQQGQLEQKLLQTLGQSRTI